MINLCLLKYFTWLWLFYLSVHTIRPSLLLIWMFFFLRVRRLSSKLLKQEYLVECLKSSFRKFYCRYGNLIQQYMHKVSHSWLLRKIEKVPRSIQDGKSSKDMACSGNLVSNDILTLDQLQWLPYRSDFSPIPWPWYRAWPLLNYEWFSLCICNGCDMPAGKSYPSGLLVPSLFRHVGLANAPIVETSFPELAVSFLDFSPLI